MIIPSKNMPLDLFIGSMVIDFPVDNVVNSATIDDWKSWGNSLVQETSFANNGAPSPYGFETRFEWEQALFNSMTSFS
jgi:hypothetical protein